MGLSTREVWPVSVIQLSTLTASARVELFPRKYCIISSKKSENTQSNEHFLQPVRIVRDLKELFLHSSHIDTITLDPCFVGTCSPVYLFL